MKNKIQSIILLGLALGLGFNVYITCMFWILLFRGTPIFVIDVNLYNEFVLEFIFFNLSTCVIIIAVVLSIRELGRYK